MKPMLARTYGPRFDRWPCYVQPKLNGVRALYQAGSFQSRDEKLWKPNVLRHLTDQLLPHFGTETPILDGELYVHGWRLQRINGAIAVNRNAPREDTDKVEFHVFDIVQPHKNFGERWTNWLLSIKDLADMPNVKLVPTGMVSNKEELDRVFHHYTSLGYEGVMLRPNGPYEYGETPHGTTKRSEWLWKYKCWEDGEFRCINVTQGEGKADIGIGALVLEHPELSEDWPDAPTFNVGTGFTDEERIEYMKNPPICKMVKVRYLCLSADGIPLNPSFLAVLS